MFISLLIGSFSLYAMDDGSPDTSVQALAHQCSMFEQFTKFGCDRNRVSAWHFAALKSLQESKKIRDMRGKELEVLAQHKKQELEDIAKIGSTIETDMEEKCRVNWWDGPIGLGAKTHKKVAKEIQILDTVIAAIKTSNHARL